MSSPLVIALPKAGNNVTEKACKLLGLSPAHHKHTANYHLAETNKVIYTYRNPRNALVSAVKYLNSQVRGMDSLITEDKLIDQFFDFFNCSLPYTYRAFAPWHKTSACTLSWGFIIKRRNEQDCWLHGCETLFWCNLRSTLWYQVLWGGKLSEWLVRTDKLDHYWKEEGVVEINKACVSACTERRKWQVRFSWQNTPLQSALVAVVSPLAALCCLYMVLNVLFGSVSCISHQHKDKPESLSGYPMKLGLMW